MQGNEIMYDRVKFFRRRQFVLGSDYADYEGWKRLKVDNGFLLSVHPDLRTSVVEHEENKAVMLGYAIDPYQATLIEEGILQRFVHGLTSVAEVISGLERLSGRFVLIVKCRAGLWLFHDAVALRQVQYCRNGRGAIWCASQAETLAERLGFDHDEEVLNYRNMPAYRVNKNGFWVLNDRTPYREIRNLLPNHYLDLRQGKAFRYWPVAGCIDSLSVEESIRLCTPILQNSIKAAAERFDLCMGISAGGDSRKSLAAAKDVKDKIKFFSTTPTQVSMLLNDVKIPARLLPQLGLKHHNLGLQFMDQEFRKCYECSATWARERTGHIAYTMLKCLGPEITVLNSNISEVAQRVYWLPESKIDGEGLAVISGLNHAFAIAEFQKWVDGAKHACQAAKMNILDLFFLEQRMGRWATEAFSEYDIAHETFNPYNNRYLHCLMLAIKERHRRNRRWDVIIKHIKYMWPEVLSEPINPPDRILDKIQQFIRRFIFHRTVTHWFPVYEYLRYLKAKRHFKRQSQGQKAG
jgi:hypothetical protein